MVSLPGRLEELVRRHGSKLPKGAEEEISLIKQDLEKIISVLHGHSEPHHHGLSRLCRLLQGRRRRGALSLTRGLHGWSASKMERRASRQHRGRPPPASRSGAGRHGSGRPMAGSAALGGKLGLRAASSVWLAAGPSTRRPVGGVVGVVGGGPEEASAWTRFWRRHAGCWRPQPAEAEVEDAGAVGVWETRWLDPPPLPRLSVTAALVAAVVRRQGAATWRKGRLPCGDGGGVCGVWRWLWLWRRPPRLLWPR